MKIEVRPIITGSDHDEALAEIEQLLDAKPGTIEAGRLENLTMLVEAYEDQHHVK